jgi:HAD superfamily phosphoserine phosphatase-like hydrolase
VPSFSRGTETSAIPLFQTIASQSESRYGQEMNATDAEFLSVTNSFVDSVVRLEPRVAAFDCDGTLWAGDAGERFFDWELRQHDMFPQPFGRSMRERYAAYLRGEVEETTMCGEMVTLHKGLSELKVIEASVHFFETFFRQQIFPEMRDLVRRLRENGCDVWAVSSSNEWLIRAGMKHFGIPENRILAAKVEVDDGTVTDRLIRVPSGPGKPQALREVMKNDIDVAFGNSKWDREMLAMSKHAFAVNPNPDLEFIAREQGWQVYFPKSSVCGPEMGPSAIRF